MRARGDYGHASINLTVPYDMSCKHIDALGSNNQEVGQFPPILIKRLLVYPCTPIDLDLAFSSDHPW